MKLFHFFSIAFTLSSEDVEEVYPVPRIVQQIKEQKDVYGTIDFHETYYQVRKFTHNYISCAVHL